jgi:opacity protein-like surface antigen
MKKTVICLALFFVLFSGGAFAQQEKSLRIHQVGIKFSNLNSFGLQYKTGGEKTLLRLSVLSLNMGLNANWGKPEDSLEIKSSNYGAGFLIGFEKRIPVIAKLDFIWGLEAGVSYFYQKQKQASIGNDYETKDWRLSPGLDVILGVNYTFSDHLVIGAEITPGIYYAYGKTKTTTNSVTSDRTNSNFGFSFNNTSAALTLAYRFGK